MGECSMPMGGGEIPALVGGVTSECDTCPAFSSPDETATIPGEAGLPRAPRAQVNRSA